MKTGSITYNGKNSLELGVFTTGSGSFDAAELDVDKYEVAGRNGDVIIPNNRYKNIEVIYPAFIPKQFGDKVQSVRNWLRSAKAYSRLEDTYDMDHFRLGLASGVQSFEPVNRNDGANFEMTFDCKPQRFLKVGETPETVEAETKTSSGEIASFDSIAVVPMTSAEVSLSPIQDLNGYDSPWPAGGGKNKLNILPLTPIKVENGITFTVNNDGTVTANGTATSQCQIYWRIPADIAKTFGNMVLDVLDGQINSGITGILEEVGAPNTRYANTAWNPVISDEIANISSAYANLILRIQQGTTVNNFLLKPMIRPADSASGFAPYTNICPISGHTGAELKIGSTYPTAVNTYSVTFADQGTVYGGTVDLVSGKLTVEEWGNIASYNGETITEPWLSSMDVYSAGATPTTGAQVVYKLATPPLEYTLSAQQIETLQGENNVWSDAGPITLTYAEPYTIENPTQYEARPLFIITNPEQGDVLSVSGKTITFVDSYTGTVTIDCETMDCYEGFANMNYLIEATDFPVLGEGTSIVTWSGSGECKMIPRWWEI